MTMRVIIAGSRTKNAYKAVMDALDQSGFVVDLDAVLSGHSGTVDLAAEKFAMTYGFDLEIYPANWKGRGRAAGPYRNGVMVGQADALIALWDGKSRGTSGIIEMARAKGLKVYIHNV